MYVLQTLTAYRNNFHETKFIFFFHKRDKLLEKYNGTWEKVRDSLKKEFDSEPVYNQKCL